MNAVAEFFHMGGYGFYVWSSYGLALVVLVMNVLVPLQRQRDLKRRLASGTREPRADP